MTAIPRLIALLSAFFLLGWSAFVTVRNWLDVAPGQHGLKLGMAWLKHEYQLDEATFEAVTKAHRTYFRECRGRCNELADIHQHFLSELTPPQKPESDLDAVQIYQETLCHECRLAMLDHVHEVARLMPETAGRRFISDVQLALQPSPRRSRLSSR